MSRECYEDATRKLLSWNFVGLFTILGRVRGKIKHCDECVCTMKEEVERVEIAHYASDAVCDAMYCSYASTCQLVLTVGRGSWSTAVIVTASV